MPEGEAPAITVEHLVKHFPRAKSNAVDDISFGVRHGEIFGLLGPNGAGKTTTIGILTTMASPSSGRATVSGIDVARDPIAAKQHIAVVPQRNNLDRGLRVGEILTTHAAYHGVARAERTRRAEVLLQDFGLSERRNQRLDLLSGGLEQRVMLARALMHAPEILFLDEPTNNLDPQTRLFLWERIRTLHAQGVTIVLTTHDMEEADQLCERIAIMDHGHLLALDTPDGLKRLIPGGTKLEVRLRVPEAAFAGHTGADGAHTGHAAHFREALESLPGVTKAEIIEEQASSDDHGGSTSLRVYASGDPGAVLANAAQAVIQARGELLDLRFAPPSLEDVFIYLTGRTLRS